MAADEIAVCTYRTLRVIEATPVVGGLRGEYSLFMRSVSLHAHFDGRQIVLDEPYDLSANASLIVTVVSKPATAPSEADCEREWLAAASTSDSFTFLADGAEDIYTMADGEPFHDVK
ncbi:MAG TPA: hypothetical protein VFC46_08570 [Humisphaera sp.]|nr:hypothetical protein [Humisphaera sp.]